MVTIKILKKHLREVTSSTMTHMGRNGFKESIISSLNVSWHNSYIVIALYRSIMLI